MPALARAACALLLSLAALAAVADHPAGSAAGAACFGDGPTQPPLNAPGKLVGTDGDDVLIGSSGDDVILGGKGNDLICGGWGSDHIDGGAGNDHLIGEVAVSTVCGAEFGNDVLLGGPGDDTLVDYCGDNTASGGAGADHLVQISGTVEGGTGDDLVEAISGFLTCPATPKECVTAHARGGPGNDEVRSTVHGDILKGGQGSDTLIDYYGFGDLSLDGGSGRDTCDAAAGDVVRRCEVVT